MRQKLNREQCIMAICRFAKDYRRGWQQTPMSDKTPLEMFEDTGYEKQHRKIRQEDIENHLRKEPSLIDEWVYFTEDKRWTPAWGFGRDKNGTWNVSYLLRNAKFQYEIYFSDPVVACALMIRMEMEEFLKPRRAKFFL